MKFLRAPAGVCVYLVLCLAWFLPGAASAGHLITATVLKVYDGDTIKVRMLSGRKEKVRFIGIDCPEVRENEKFARDMERERRHTAEEMLELGRRASEFTEMFCPPGTQVLIETDAEERDRYGRLLAYVWVRPRLGSGGPGRYLLLNRELLRAGLARLMTIPPNVKYLDDFRKIERWAVDNRKGIWAK